MVMCPYCGDLFRARTGLIPEHGVGANCLGSLQIPRNPESDGRPLWNGKSNPHFYKNKNKQEQAEQAG